MSYEYNDANRLEQITKGKTARSPPFTSFPVPAAIESLPHRRRAAMLTRYREPISTVALPAARGKERSVIEPLATRTTAVHAPSWDPAPPADATGQRDDALRSRIRRLLASGALHRRPWRLSTRLRLMAGDPEPCVVCFDLADTTYEEPASKFTVAAHAEPCGRLWIEEALETHE